MIQPRSSHLLEQTPTASSRCAPGLTIMIMGTNGSVQPHSCARHSRGEAALCVGMATIALRGGASAEPAS